MLVCQMSQSQSLHVSLSDLEPVRSCQFAIFRAIQSMSVCQIQNGSVHVSQSESESVSMLVGPDV